MKKLAIAGASVALAAMPVVGVFAATTTDTLTLEVPGGCNITTTRTSDTTAAFGSVAPGNTKTDATDPIVVTCNAAWQLVPTITKELQDDAATPNVIHSSATLSGPTSAWALQLAVSGSAGTIGNGFNANNEVDGTNKLTAAAAADGFSITPTYTVYVAPGQAVGDYDGTVLYTVSVQP